ncbi:hypothetical protein cypCar_00047448, partial [Cyprinus carpio]
GVRTEERSVNGETARALAMMYGHTKIASLIDTHVMRAKSYKEMYSFIAEVPVAPGYVTFRDAADQSEGICNRDVTSPINELDGQSNSSRDELFDSNLPTVRSSSSSSEGLSHLLGHSREASLESNEVQTIIHHQKHLRRTVLLTSHHVCRTLIKQREDVHVDPKAGVLVTASVTVRLRLPLDLLLQTAGPQGVVVCDLGEFLEQIGFSKYLPLLEEQDIDLRIFLTLTENDLKEVGITLFGPKRKMTSAIARWHSNARPPSDALEQAYADQLEAEMQEMAIQLHKRCVEVESLQGQVSQEKELRAVMEGCLMEEKMAWKSAQAELQENSKRFQMLSGKLHALHNTHAQPTQEDTRTVGKGDGLMCSQLLSHMAELADGLKEILHSLQRLSASEKRSHNWEES